MANEELLYRIQFISNGERYELYVKTLMQGSLFGFVEIGDFVWDTHTSVVLDPSHEKLKSEFSGVTKTYIPMHNVLRIDAVNKKGSAKITQLENKSDKVTVFPSPIYTPTKE
ncbi:MULTISPECIES: DUF1820 family protein [Alteromonas]|jgi:hypothetical protein|uniref:DUF1820 family protein n=1 Tax=Alteromonas hispanica TaxID=315421 RepID=A0A6L9MYJ4_9ALTE|nr:MULTISPECIES: DUF1820 family protein [Alteromonas]APE04395.1 hypothetical protein BM528_00230 [Alteromonas sp. RW2A1]AUC86800.1 DUF1820 domain-containing protein [Alteromonas sp. MB-3u-76]MAI65054.1 DUF1820 domain-containing protein [Alteromonas sp.]NDW23228.1 DUF1820 family protein [Alteromonas hispanica]